MFVCMCVQMCCTVYGSKAVHMCYRGMCVGVVPKVYAYHRVCGEYGCKMRKM